MARSRFKLESLLTLGAILAGGYVAYRIIRASDALGNAARKGLDYAAGAGTNLLEWIKPLDIGDMQAFTVEFPDGSRHSVGSRAVKSDGTFSVPTQLTDSTGRNPYLAVADIPTLRGKYRLAIDRSIVSGVNKFAIRI